MRRYANAEIRPLQGKCLTKNDVYRAIIRSDADEGIYMGANEKRI